MRNNRAGFTLVEGLFALFLVSLVLGAVVHTLNQALEVKSNRKNLDQTSEDFHALQRIQRDVNASLQVLTPDLGESSSQLVVKRIDSSLSFLDRTSPLGPGPHPELDPFEESETSTVKYFHEDGYLLRTSQSSSDSNEEIARLLKTSDFEVSRSSEDLSLLNLKLVVSRERVTKVRSLSICVRASE